VETESLKNLTDDDYLATELNFGSNFQKIVQFYVLECPVVKTGSNGEVERISKRGITFEEQGWKGALFHTLKAQMMEQATPSLKCNYHPCKTEDLEEMFVQVMDSVPFGEEYCVFEMTDKKGVMRSLFSSIRHSIAHADFGMKSQGGKTAYYFVNNNGGYIKAKIVLMETTLIKWIATFKSDPQRFKQK